MAEKKEESKIVLERAYNVPLRHQWLRAPKWNRTKKAVKAMREFLQRHMKSEDVKLGIHLNELLWKHGIKNPPHHVKVIARKNSEGTVFAELEGVEMPKPAEKKVEAKQVKEEPKKDAPKPAPVQKPAEKKVEPKPAEKKEVPKPAAPKPVEKKEVPKPAQKSAKDEKEMKEVEEITKQILQKGTARR